MNRTHSEFDARRAARAATHTSVLVLALLLSACASKSAGLAGRSPADARTAAAAGGVSSQKSLKSTGSSSEALAGKAGASSLDANGSRSGNGSQAGRSDGASSTGKSAGGPVDPMSGVVVRQVAGADGTGADGVGVMKSDSNRASLAADSEARSREAERLESEARARAAAGGAATADAGASARAGAAAGAGTPGRAGTAGDAGEVAGQNGREGSVAGAGGAGGVGGADGSARAGGATGSGDTAKSTLAYADANDPVAAALARADAARARGDLDGSGNGTGPSSGKSGSGAVSGGGAAGSTGGANGTDGSRGANGEGADPVADALRRAEQALRDAKLAAEREAAERRGRVDTAGSNVKIEENERQQTLDGMLPMALDMDERGLFEFDRYELRNEVKSTLDLLAEKLKSAEYDRLVILGYTDRIGTDDYNRQLSDKRAWAVAGYLMNRGVPPHKLKVEGRGERDSVTGDEACEGLKRAEMIQCLQRDRRVEIAATVKEYNLRVQ